MQAEIKKWGNSLAIRLPRHILEEAALKEGTPVEVSVEGGAVVVRSTRKKFILADLLKDHPKPEGNVEYDWGAPVGEDEW